ncbi:mitochondrial inner membrane protease subunit 2 isoform X3 [Pseudophryne corroboree]|uniref:mitochondrial inner membrane protease subunit 2 isoform X3 n=1 Tax=Pseudophryne corroboree TaxID=495146 RepID=UPI003082173B
MAQLHGRRYIRAFVSGFFVAVPVTVTFLDRVACIARVEGVSMQPSLNPGDYNKSDVVLLNRWSVRNYEVQRGDIVSLVCVLIHRGFSLKNCSSQRATFLATRPRQAFSFTPNVCIFFI